MIIVQNENQSLLQSSQIGNEGIGQVLRGSQMESVHQGSQPFTHRRNDCPQGGKYVTEKVIQITVAFVKRQPRHLSDGVRGRLGQPLQGQRRLAVPGGTRDDGQSTIETCVQPLQKTRPRHEVLAHGRSGELRGDEDLLGTFGCHRSGLLTQNGEKWGTSQIQFYQQTHLPLNRHKIHSARIIVTSCQLRCRNSKRPLRSEPHLPIQNEAPLGPFQFTEDLALNEKSHSDANVRVAKESCSQNRVRKSVSRILVLSALVSSASMPLPNWALAQTNPTASSTPTASTDVQPIRRRPPAPSSTHGSISGSQPNELADHPIASLLDQISEQNCLNVEFYGYLQQGLTLNPDSPRDRSNGPVLNNYRSNAYQMNGLYLVGERKVDPDCCAVQLGGRVDTLYGTDAAFGLSEGFDADLVSDESSRFYKLAFPQIYGNVFLPIGPGISCKVGKFYSLVGNEWLYNTENFFYSHFLSWNIQPGTHTGALFETKLSDQWELRFGPNLGWNTSENSNRAISYLGSLQWTSPDERSQVYFAFQNGKQRTVITTADSNVLIYSLVVNQDISDRWHYMLEHDLLVSNSRTGTAERRLRVVFARALSVLYVL